MSKKQKVMRQNNIENKNTVSIIFSDKGLVIYNISECCFDVQIIVSNGQGKKTQLQNLLPSLIIRVHKNSKVSKKAKF